MAKMNFVFLILVTVILGCKSSDGDSALKTTEINSSETTPSIYHERAGTIGISTPFSGGNKLKYSCELNKPGTNPSKHKCQLIIKATKGFEDIERVITHEEFNTSHESHKSIREVFDTTGLERVTACLELKYDDHSNSRINACSSGSLSSRYNRTMDIMTHIEIGAEVKEVSSCEECFLLTN